LLWSLLFLMNLSNSCLTKDAYSRTEEYESICLLNSFKAFQNKAMVFYPITIFLLFLLLENLPQIHKIWLVCPNKLLLFSTGSYFFSAKKKKKKKKKINQQMRLFISFSLFLSRLILYTLDYNDNLKARNKKVSKWSFSELGFYSYTIGCQTNIENSHIVSDQGSMNPDIAHLSLNNSFC
jgi:hypothetical protein